MSPANEPTSLTLLARAQEQQPDAWDRLVELYAPLVHYWCRKSDLSAEDTADIFQDVFRSVSEKIADFRRDREGDTFRGWLRIITQNKIRDLFRREMNNPPAQGGSVARERVEALQDPLADTDDEQEENVIRSSLHRALEWIQGDFEERTWQAFWKCQVEEIPTEDIAAQLDMTTAAVRKAKYRVLRRLREELAGLVE